LKLICYLVIEVTFWRLINQKEFLRATAVPAGTAEVRISYGNSVRLSVRPSVCHNPVQIQGQVR